MPSARRILDRCEALARHSELAGGLTRVYLSEEQRHASGLVLGWMREAGMAASIDAVGNTVGRYEGERPGLPCLMLGSHLDSVRDAGIYDGALGVIAAIECVASLHRRGARLPFAIEVLGFADEEGVRFSTTLLGSRAVAGSFRAEALQALDKDGVTLAEAMRRYGLDPERVGEAARPQKAVLAYAELHIEQGPVLEAEGLPVGVVTAINGATRYACAITGVAGHAGTVPMGLRRDALAAAAECVMLIEARCASEPGLVGTVGKLETLPGAVNVIPGGVRFSIDVRAPSDSQRADAAADVLDGMQRVCARRGVELSAQKVHDAPVTACAPWLQEAIAAAVAARGHRVHRLPSGAGHDGMAMSALTSIGMLFVRCAGGISHHPAEAVTLADVDAGAGVLQHFIERFRPQAA